MTKPQWISVQQAAKLGGYNKEWVRQMIRKGRIMAQKLPGAREWLVDRQSLEAHMLSMKKLGTSKHNLRYKKRR